MNYKIIALSIASILLLNGCESMQKASTAMGSTGTGVLAGVLTGAGTGILCDKLTGGKNTGACVAAGMAVGAAAGTWAASLDKEREKSVAGMDCATVKRRMNYPSTANTPKAVLSLASPSSLVVKPGQKLKIPVKMDLASPGSEGKEEEVAFKMQATDGNFNALTKGCGGDYLLPVTFPTDKEGVHNGILTLINASNGNEIEGGSLKYCYTVSSNGVDNKCGGMISASAEPEKFTQPSKKSKHRRRR
ncbi:hypothetical protein [Crenothrix sp.]|uniref:hypothetical protein n=1 Tax=Crenothrix sp. TaxID=3100433 RepID=UPI00374CFF46